jgi:hypothetical protein
MLEKCNIYECLRKFKENAEDTISDFCDVIGDEDRKKLIFNSKECPLFCNKFWDYELEKEITKHEDVHYISTKYDEFNDKYYHGLFMGLSNEGATKQEEREVWENKHENTDTIICPYCDYEFEGYDCIYDEGEDTIECESCGKEFNVTTEVSYSWSTSKLEEYED